MSEPAFLRAIADNSTADGPRLVYADWLDERGDSRAAFLRADCELAAVAPPDERFAPLKARLRELSWAVDPAWAAAVGREPLHLEPDELDLGAQGWGHQTIRWQDERLIFYPSGSWVKEDPPVDVRPSAAEWEAFWAAVDSTGAWDWKDDYGRGVVCGTPWGLTLAYGGRRLACGGNGFGGDFAPPEFDTFFAALSRLIRRDEWYERRFARRFPRPAR
jgi:uncharacterized protein (TIGR02996 family)